MFLAVRELRFAKSRFVLVGAVITLIALLTTFLSGLANGLVDDGISGLRNLPLTHLAFQDGSQSTFSRSILRPPSLEVWEQVADAEATPLGVSFFNARTGDGGSIDVAMYGIDPDGFLASGLGLTEHISAEAQVVLNSDFEDQGIQVGDSVTVLGPDKELTVSGFADTGTYGHVDIAFGSLAEWQELVYGDNAQGRFSAIAVDATGEIDFSSVDKAAGTEVDTKEQAYAGSPGYSAETSTMSLIRGFLLVISALIVGAFFMVWTVQRTRQIGLMKALGASNAYVLRDALGQLAIVLFASIALGALIGVGIGSQIGSGAPFSLEPGPVLSSMAALFVLGLAGSLVAIRRVVSVDPATPLSTEQG